MKVAPGVLCYVRPLPTDVLADQIRGRVVTAVRRLDEVHWEIQPYLKVVVTGWGRDPHGHIILPGPNAIHGLHEQTLVPIAAPGGREDIAEGVRHLQPAEVPQQ